MSPNLFNIYINDLPEIFDSTCAPVKLDKLTTNCLMFADDLLIMSETAVGLQNSLNKLQKYCNKWQLSININKTKVMTFQQRNILDTCSDFFINGKKLEKVLKYKYLGNIIESSGKFHSCQMELSKKGCKVLFSLFKYLNPIDNVPVAIYIKNYLSRWFSPF